MAVFDGPRPDRYAWIPPCASPELRFSRIAVSRGQSRMSIRRVCSVLLVLCFAAAVPAHADETIVFMRHGEKPSGGLGQLTCQGLNRALALPSVLIGKFGRPDFVYAPNPNVKMNDPAGSFY